MPNFLTQFTEPICSLKFRWMGERILKVLDFICPQSDFLYHNDGWSLRNHFHKIPEIGSQIDSYSCTLALLNHDKHSCFLPVFIFLSPMELVIQIAANY